MLELALAHGKGYAQLNEIARRQKLPAQYLGQIIIPLRTHGLVRSGRGAKGGYSLTKPPSQITVFDIREAIEGRLELMQKEKINSSNMASITVTKAVWSGLEQVIIDTLKATTLEQLAQQYSREQTDENNFVI